MHVSLARFDDVVSALTSIQKSLSSLVSVLTGQVAATSQSAPANPTGTTSTAGVMMGLGGSITPATTGKILIVISGSVVNPNVGDGGTIQIYAGAGAAPANGHALTGQAQGGACLFVTGGAFDIFPFSVNAVKASGLAVGTTYWIDLGVAAVAGGTVSLTNISISVIEIG